MLKNKGLYLVLLFSLPIFYELIIHYGIADKSQLTSKTWHSTMNVLLPEKKPDWKTTEFEKIKKATIISDIRYLMDGTYIQESKISTYDVDNETIFSLDISNIGNWKYEQGYLFLESSDIKDFSTGHDNFANKRSIDKFKEIFLVHMLQVQRMDIVSDDMMLMTSVDNTSRLWVASQ